ncbi:MAG: acyl-CoA dehydrogenase [Planctomycetota bacterium]|nr:MAG: acyl-CoA dehydrogenase [Planctomycetota bacterium]
MLYELTEEEAMLRDMVRDFAAKELEPKAEHYDQTETFPHEHFEKMGELGLMGMLIPEEYGGSDMGLFAEVLAVEELAYSCASTAITMAVHNSLVTGPIVRCGNEEQKQEFLPGLASGERLGAYCLTEPNTGSDAASLEMTAVKKGDKYVLNGTKSWISTAGVSGVMLLFARTDKDAAKKKEGISAFIVTPDLPGLTIGKEEKKLGLRASNTVQIILEDCEVPADRLLGEENTGFKIALNALSAGRIGVAAQALGIHRACLDESVRYSQERHQFDQPIANFQAIKVKIADMAMELEAARWLVWQAAKLRDAGQPCIKEASMAKLFAAEAANRAAREAVQIHGGYGYMKEYKVERLFRDAKVLEIYEGTSEIQRLVISREVLA